MGVDVIIASVVGIISILVLLLKLVFDYATLKATTSQTLKEILEIKKYLMHHDDKIDDLEKRVTILEAEHCINHTRR